MLREELDIDDLQVTRELSAIDVPEWDSLSHIRIIVAAEKLFATRFSIHEISDLSSVGDFVDLVYGHKNPEHET